jgi:CheY-like chemotaxis protein
MFRLEFPPSPRGQILLVEDQPELRESLSELLQEEGYRVRTAQDGAEALRLLRSGPVPDLILLDLVMPRMSGWDFAVAKDIDCRLAPIPLILLSGAGALRHQEQPLAADAVLEKPFEVDQLFSLLRRHCRAQRRLPRRLMPAAVSVS